MSGNNSGTACYKLGFYLIFGGLGSLMLVVCLGGVFVQGVWEMGETHNVQPEQVAQTTAKVVSSPGGGAVLAIGMGMLIVIGLLAVVFKGTASMSQMVD